MNTIKNTTDLLSYLIEQAGSGDPKWFGFQQQKIMGIKLAYEIAKLHADKMTPDEVVEYVIRLNGAIFHKLIVGKNNV